MITSTKFTHRYWLGENWCSLHGL